MAGSRPRLIHCQRSCSTLDDVRMQSLRQIVVMLQVETKLRLCCSKALGLQLATFLGHPTKMMSFLQGPSVAESTC